MLRLTKHQKADCMVVQRNGLTIDWHEQCPDGVPTVDRFVSVITSNGEQVFMYNISSFVDKSVYSSGILAEVKKKTFCVQLCSIPVCSSITYGSIPCERNALR